MSEPIYREADEDEAAAYFDSCLRNPFNVKEILGVPVEPDYEAATAKLIEQGPSDFTDENVARNIIHAAFKGAEIGGDDDATSGLFGVDVLQANIETTMSEPTLYDLDELVRAANVQHVPTSLKLLLKEAVPVERCGGDDELSLSDSTRRTSDRIGGD